MSDKKPTSGEVSVAYLIYGLHGFGAITGVITTAFVVTAFLTGWPSILAVLITYLKRDDVKGTYLETHFTWTLRTFWWAMIWLLVGGMFFMTGIGIFLALLIWFFTGIWVLYRIIRGLMRLLSEVPMPVD